MKNAKIIKNFYQCKEVCHIWDGCTLVCTGCPEGNEDLYIGKEGQKVRQETCYGNC